MWFCYEIWNFDIIYIVFIEYIIIIGNHMTLSQAKICNEPVSQWQHPYRHVLHVGISTFPAFPAMPDPRKAEKSYLQDHEQAKRENIAIIFMYLSTKKIQYITYIKRLFLLSYLWNNLLKMPKWSCRSYRLTAFILDHMNDSMMLIKWSSLDYDYSINMIKS